MTRTTIVYSTSDQPYHWDQQGGDKRQDDCYTLMVHKEHATQSIEELKADGYHIVSVADQEQHRQAA